MENRIPLEFVEPITYHGRSVFGEPSIEVTKEFYEKYLLERPQEYTKSDGNAYVFGPLFPLEEYQYLGEHGNDAAQTGFIRPDLYNKNNDFSDNDFSDKWEQIYYEWDWKAALGARKLIPYVVWIGKTVGGDVGAGLYGHYDAEGNINSLIVDNFYFMNKDETIEDETTEDEE